MRYSVRKSDPEFPRAKQTHDITIPPNPIGVAVHAVFEQHLDLTSPMKDDRE